MSRITADEIVVLFVALGVLLASARLMGELARRFNQPAVIGEILAGILLGPTVFGQLAPRVSLFLFPQTGHVALVMDGLVTLAVVLFLLVAGMELDLSIVWRQGKMALAISLAGIAIPFALGFSLAWFLPWLLGFSGNVDLLIFALFFATALAISALPVIARTLMDLNLYKTDLGMLIIGSAILDDIAGWIIFALILGMMGHGHGRGMPISHTLWLTIAYAGGMLTVGRWLINRIIPWIQAHASWPGGVLGLALTLALFGAAFTEWIGVHAIFGSFLVGVALGDSPHLREQTRSILHQFISFIFAPLFFASIGLRVNFLQHFDYFLTLVVLVVACIGKVWGCGLSARLMGMPKREAWAIGFGMNARGAMEIVLGMLALQAGVIQEPMFVALVIMALATSMLSGPAMERLLRRHKPRKFTQYLSSRTFVPRLKSRDRREAIQELTRLVSTAQGLDEQMVDSAVWLREQASSTSLGHEVDVPHARLEGLKEPVVGLGLSEDGIDSDSEDGLAARFIFLILTPANDYSTQVDILADLARSLRDPDVRGKLIGARNYTEFLALLRTSAC